MNHISRFFEFIDLIDGPQTHRPSQNVCKALRTLNDPHLVVMQSCQLHRMLIPGLISSTWVTQEIDTAISCTKCRQLHITGVSQGLYIVACTRLAYTALAASAKLYSASCAGG